LSSSLSLSFYSSLHRSNQLLKVQAEYHAPLLEQNRQPVLLATQAAPLLHLPFLHPQASIASTEATAPQQWRPLRHCALQDIWKRKNGTQVETALQGGEEIARNPFNFKDWECDLAAQKWLEFQPVLGVREYWAVV